MKVVIDYAGSKGLLKHRDSELRFFLLRQEASDYKSAAAMGIEYI